MATNFQLKIITPERIVYEDEVFEVTVPTRAGEIAILARHTPLVSVLASGEMKVKKDDYEVFFAVSRGVVEVRAGHEVIILTDFAEHAEEIDLAAAQAGRKRAEEMLAEKDKLSDEDFAHFEAMLEREFARVKLASKKQRLE